MIVAVSFKSSVVIVRDVFNAKSAFSVLRARLNGQMFI